MADKDAGKDMDDQDKAPEPTLDGESGDGMDEEGGRKLDARKILLFVLLPLFALAAIGGGLYFTGMLDGLLGKGDADTEMADGGEHGGGHGEKKSSGGHGGGHGGGDENHAGAHFLEIPNLTVNLSGEEGETRFLRLSVQLELASGEDKAAVEAVMPRVVDQFQTYLRELRVRDLRGSQGIYRLQMELLSRVNAAAYPVEVKDVLFQEILIQ